MAGAGSGHAHQTDHDHAGHDHDHAHGSDHAHSSDHKPNAADVLAKKVFLASVLGAAAYVGTVILFVLMGRL